MFSHHKMKMYSRGVSGNSFVESLISFDMQSFHHLSWSEWNLIFQRAYFRIAVCVPRHKNLRKSVSSSFYNLISEYFNKSVHVTRTPQESACQLRNINGSSSPALIHGCTCPEWFSRDRQQENWVSLPRWIRPASSRTWKVLHNQQRKNFYRIHQTKTEKNDMQGL